MAIACSLSQKVATVTARRNMRSCASHRDQGRAVMWVVETASRRSRWETCFLGRWHKLDMLGTFSFGCLMMMMLMMMMMMMSGYDLLFAVSFLYQYTSYLS